MKKIVANVETRKALMDKFNCSQTTISDALNFVGHSLTQRKIRSYAVNKLKSHPIIY